MRSLTLAAIVQYHGSLRQPLGQPVCAATLGTLGSVIRQGNPREALETKRHFATRRQAIDHIVGQPDCTLPDPPRSTGRNGPSGAIPSGRALVLRTKLCQAGLGPIEVGPLSRGSVATNLRLPVSKFGMHGVSSSSNSNDHAVGSRLGTTCSSIQGQATSNASAPESRTRTGQRIVPRAGAFPPAVRTPPRANPESLVRLRQNLPIHPFHL